MPRHDRLALALLALAPLTVACGNPLTVTAWLNLEEGSQVEVSGFAVPIEGGVFTRIDVDLSDLFHPQGTIVVEQVRIDDLHEISPDEFLEFGDAIVHDLSYQQARHYNRGIEGVYVANPGYMFSRAAIPRGARKGLPVWPRATRLMMARIMPPMQPTVSAWSARLRGMAGTKAERASCARLLT